MQAGDQAAPAKFPDPNARPGFPNAHGTDFSDRVFGRVAWGEVPRSTLEIKLIGVLSALRDRAQWWVKVSGAPAFSFNSCVCCVGARCEYTDVCFACLRSTSAATLGIC